MRSRGIAGSAGLTAPTAFPAVAEDLSKPSASAVQFIQLMSARVYESSSAAVSAFFFFFSWLTVESESLSTPVTFIMKLLHEGVLD